MSYRAIIAESLVENRPQDAKELQDGGHFEEYLDLAEKNARDTAAFVRRNIGDGPAERVIAREIALAQETEESGVPNEFQMMREDGFPL